MPKPNKSSASSGTRKKQAAKKADKSGQGQGQAPGQGGKGGKQLTKAEKKALKNAPKQKIYVPPPKPPAPAIPDPLDSQGLARTLPAELVVVLRRLGKKDSVTKRKGLEEFKDGWVDIAVSKKPQADAEMEEVSVEDSLLEALPVWLHNLPSLLLSPSHRALALSIQTSLLSIPAISSSLQNTLALGLFQGEHQCRDVISTWLTASVEESGRRQFGQENPLGRFEMFSSWESVDGSAEQPETGKLQMLEQLGLLVEYMEMALLSPHDLHDEIHPAPKSVEPTSGTATPKKGAKGLPVAPAFAPFGSTTKVDEDAVEEESQKAERVSRYNLSGVIGLTYILKKLPQTIEWSERLLNLLNSAALWNMMRPVVPRNETAASPPVRRAIYGLLSVLITKYETILGDKLITTVGPAVLRSVWRETDQSVWGGTTVSETIIMFLTKFRNVWKITTNDSTIGEDDTAVAEKADEDDDDSDEESDDEDEADDEAAAPAEQKQPIAAATEAQSPYTLGMLAYKDFMGYLQRGCNGSASEGYPTVLVILSTLPVEILPPTVAAYRALFTSLWGAADAKLLTSTSSAAGPSSMFQFLTAAIDCIVFLSIKAWKSATEDSGRNDVKALVADETQRVWSEGILVEASKLARMDRSMFAEKRLESTREALALSKALSRLATESNALSSAAIEQICSVSRSTFAKKDSSNQIDNQSILMSRFSALCEALGAGFVADDTMAQALNSLIHDVTLACVGTASDSDASPTEKEDSLKLITKMLDTKGDILRQTEDLVQALESLMQHQLLALFTSVDHNFTGPLCREYLGWLQAADARESTWKNISLVVDQLPVEKKFDIAQALLTTWYDPTASLGVDGTAWGHIVMQAAEVADESNPSKTSARAFVSAVLLHAGDIIDDDTRQGLLTLVTTAISSAVNEMYAAGSSDAIDVGGLVGQLEVVRQILEQDKKQITESELHKGVLPSIHEIVIFGSLLEPAVGPELVNAAGSCLDAIAGVTSSDQYTKVMVERILGLLEDVSFKMDPADIIGQLLAQSQTQRYLPSAKKLIELSESAMRDCLDRSSKYTLPMVFDDLLPYQNEESIKGQEVYDHRGRSTYGRRLEATIAVLRNGRSAVRESQDIFHHLLLAGRILQDEVLSPGSSFGIYQSDVSPQYIQSLTSATEDMVSYATNGLSSDLPPAWHAETMTAITKGTHQDSKSVLTATLGRLVAEGEDNCISPRVLRSLLGRILRSAGENMLIERWLAFAQNLEIKKPTATRALLQAATPLLERSPRLDRVRNETASRLTSVPVGKADTEGLRLIRNLQATAPPADSEDVFLPEQRTIFLMQHLNSWLTSDEDAADDLSEELEARICLLYTQFAPIVQARPGAHWNSVFDMISNNLETASLADSTTYNLLSATLALVSQIVDLTASNKALAADWVDRDEHARLLVQLLISLSDANQSGSTARDRLVGQICDVLDALSTRSSLVADVSALYTLLRYENLDVQRIAYRIARGVIVTRTADLVLEMETAIGQEDSSKTPKLPTELLASISSVGEESIIPFGTLLAWMLIFDHFDEASSSLRSAYTDQIRDSGAVQNEFMTHMPETLRLACSGVSSKDSVMFAVDEFHLELLEKETEQANIALSAHVFYRAMQTVPQLIRNWYEACKDRQLTMAFIAVVTRHVSPVLIEQEFAVVRQPGVLQELESDSLTVKVLTGSPEVTAKYIIDEQPMEISIRFPQEYPLRSIEVKEINRVGVTEGKWRGWMLNVQQLVMSRNGLLLEALKLFKSNVSLHFEGKTECSICYSIISMNDRSLPSRACPTCKNKYHANCLFTWFKSSNSSTCPMCRSLF